MIWSRGGGWYLQQPGTGSTANGTMVVVPPTRFERAAYGLGIHCSILLSYGGTYCGILLRQD